MTLRDNQESGYNSERAAIRDRELRREHARVRAVRRARAARGEVETGETEATEHGGEGTSTASRRAERLRRRRVTRARHSRRFVNGQPATPPVPQDQGPSLAERMDVADESHDTYGRRVDMGVHVDEWEMVLRVLKHMECVETNQLLKAKTVESLWAKEGAEVEDS